MSRRFLVTIACDENDGDYVKESHIMNLEELENTLKLFKKLKFANEGNNYRARYLDMYKGELTEEELEKIRDLCPYPEFGFHTIESIKYYEILSDEMIYMNKHFYTM